MLNKSSIITYLKIFLLFSFALLVFSCIKQPNNQPTEIRIVDLNGKPKPIKRMMPEGNTQMLAMQNKEISENSPFPNINSDNLATANQPPADNYLSQNDQNSTTTQPLTKNLSRQNDDTTITSNKPVEAAVSYDMSEDNNINEDEINAQQNTKKIANSELTGDHLVPNSSQKTSQSNKKFKFITTKTKVVNNDSDIISSEGDIFIQIGFFSSSANADSALAKSKTIANGSIKETNVNGQNGYKVFLGPISSHQKAIKILTKAKKSGYRDAFITQ